MMTKFNIYEPIFTSIPVEPVYEGEFYGLSHEKAKKLYEYMKKEGFYDERYY